METEKDKIVEKLEDQIEKREESLAREPLPNHQGDIRAFERNFERIRQAKNLLEKAHWY